MFDPCAFGTPASRRRFGRILAAATVAVAVVCPTVPAGPQKDGEAWIKYDFSTTMQVGFQAKDDKGMWQRLTFSPYGTTNITLLHIDGQVVEFGSGDGEWESKRSPLVGKRRGDQSVWVARNIKVTQTVEIVASATGKLDMCWVTYQVENTDSNAKPKVRLRALVDTCIGDNDGPTFAVEDHTDLIVRCQAFGKEAKIPVPLYLRVFEVANAEYKKQIVATLTLKAPGATLPDRLLITRWPNDPHKWDVEVVDMGDDSAAVLYWDRIELAPAGKEGASFQAGYGYGLGLLKAN